MIENSFLRKNYKLKNKLKKYQNLPIIKVFLIYN